MSTQKTITSKHVEQFDLQDFFPYLVRIFYADVTSAISATYNLDYDLSPAEWRCMVILGMTKSLTANEIVERSSMDKVTVSRAIARMKKREWITVGTNIDDGRSKLLTLTNSGKDIYLDLVPKVLEVERKLLSGIDESQKKQFLRTMDKIRENKAHYSL